MLNKYHKPHLLALSSRYEAQLLDENTTWPVPGQKLDVTTLVSRHELGFIWDYMALHGFVNCLYGFILNDIILTPLLTSNMSDLYGFMILITIWGCPFMRDQQRWTLQKTDTLFQETSTYGCIYNIMIYNVALSYTGCLCIVIHRLIYCRMDLLVVKKTTEYGSGFFATNGAENGPRNFDVPVPGDFKYLTGNPAKWQICSATRGFNRVPAMPVDGT